MRRLCLLFPVVAAMASIATRAAPARADAPAGADDRDTELELRMGFAGFQLFEPQLLVGLPLGQRLVLLAGVAVTAGEARGPEIDFNVVEASVPIELKIYLGRPDEGALVPTARLGVSFGYRWMGQSVLEEPERRLRAELVAGVVYFVSRSFGVTAEAGVEHTRAWQADMRSWWLGMTYRAGVLFRI